jgi:transposase
MTQTNKGTKRQARRSYDFMRGHVIREVAQNMGVSISYVRKVLDGFSSYGRADEIKAAFNKRYNEIKQLLNQNQ